MLTIILHTFDTLTYPKRYTYVDTLTVVLVLLLVQVGGFSKEHENTGKHQRQKGGEETTEGRVGPLVTKRKTILGMLYVRGRKWTTINVRTDSCAHRK